MNDNPNGLWSTVFVEELARNGLQAVCITPGSRSTPLALAFAACEGIAVYSHIDERSSAFFGLGMALASGKPVALLCTSGTAAANFYPAIIEANYGEVPLLVLTADRPHELRDSGSNQTIEQTRIYGEHVRWSVEVAPPEANPNERSLRYLRTLAARALATADGVPAGAVHLNFPFRKPLEPDGRARHSDEVGVAMNGRAEGRAATRITRGRLTPTETQVDELAAIVKDAPRGIIVCGPRCPGDGFAATVTRLAKLTGYPIFADPLSGVRFGPHLEQSEGLIIGGFDTFLQEEVTASWDKPQVVLQIGAMPTSKALMAYLERSADGQRILITNSGRWADDSFRLSEVVWAEPELTCCLLAGQLDEMGLARSEQQWAATIIEASGICWDVIDDVLASRYFEGAILDDVVALLPSDATLFVASSLSVRHLDQFGRPRAKSLRIYANRGASGIDGTVSSALGAAAVCDGPLVLVTGDLAFYHDLNGLLALRRHNINVTIVLINNDGGGIFHRLPIANFEPPFSELFVTPHGLDFEPVGTLYGAKFVRATTRDALRQALQASVAASSPHIIEVPSDSAEYEQTRREIVEAVVERLTSLSVPTLQSKEEH